MSKNIFFKELIEFGNIRELLDYSLKNTPDSVAYRFKVEGVWQQKLFKETYNDVKNLSAWFLKEGFRGEKISIIGPSTYPWIVAALSVMNAGAVAVPLDKGLSDEDLAEKVAFSDSTVLIYDEEYASLTKLCGENVRFISMNEIEKEFSNDENGKNPVDNVIDSDSVALISFTSGTTSVGKAVMLSHRNILTSTVIAGITPDFPGGSILMFLPLNHLYGVCHIFWAQFAGATLILNDSMKNLMANMQLHKPTIMLAVPQLIDTIYDKINKNLEEKNKLKTVTTMRKVCRVLKKFGIDIRRKVFAEINSAAFGGNLGALCVGGAAMDLEKMKFFQDVGIDMLQGYGCTEASPVVCSNIVNHTKLEAVGYVFPYNEVRIKNGEIQVRGKNIMKGYYKDEEATKAAFDGEWLKTGDIGRLDDDGFLYVTGRVKNLIILANGENVSPEVLEDKIQKIDVVAEVIVKESDGKICAEVFMNENGMSREAAEKHLRSEIAALNRTLPTHHNISKIEIRDTAFERNNLQKIKRNQEK